MWFGGVASFTHFRRHSGHCRAHSPGNRLGLAGHGESGLADNWQRGRAPDRRPARTGRELAALAARVGDQTATAAVVKADALRRRPEPAAEALAEAGCHTFFVALPDEGARLRRTVHDAQIYVLDGLVPGSTELLISHDLRPVLSSMPEIEEWAEVKASGVDTSAAIQVDTGMNRLGLTVSEARTSPPNAT